MGSVKLFIPGPVDVSSDVAAKMAEPMVGHRSKAYSDLQASTVSGLKKLMKTENEVFIAASSSTGWMEAAVRNCVSKKALHIVNGAFSKRWSQISLACGKDHEIVDITWGSAIKLADIKDKLNSGEYDTLFITHNETSTGVMTPLAGFGKICADNDILFCVDAVSSLAGVDLPVDDLGIDVLVVGTQKCLAVAPGMAMTSVSSRALERSANMSEKGYYFDYKVCEKYNAKNHTHSTPPIPQINALDYQIKKILDVEGLDSRFARHAQLASYTRDWAAKNFEMFPEEWCLSDTVSCIKNTGEHDLVELSKNLLEKGYLFSNGYGNLKGETFRVAHMGDRSLDELKEYLDNIGELLGL